MSKDKDSKYTPAKIHINESPEHVTYFLCIIMHKKERRIVSEDLDFMCIVSRVPLINI